MTICIMELLSFIYLDAEADVKNIRAPRCLPELLKGLWTFPEVAGVTEDVYNMLTSSQTSTTIKSCFAKRKAAMENFLLRTFNPCEG